MLKFAGLAIALAGLCVSLVLWSLTAPKVSSGQSEPSVKTPESASFVNPLHVPGTDVQTKKNQSRNAPVALPPPDAPLIETRQMLAEAARSGDIEAARRLLHDVRVCIRLGETKELVRQQLNEQPGNGDNAEEIGKREQRLERREHALQNDAKYEKTCDGISPQEAKASVYSALLLAANAGDEDAASCYIVAAYDPKTVESTQKAPQEYIQSSWNFLNEGIERGDWTTVTTLQLLYGENRYNDHRWFFDLAPTNPLEAYKMLRLRQLGTTPDGMADIEQEMAQFLKKSELTADQIGAVNDWAQQIFDQYFIDRPKISGPSPGCMHSAREPY